MSMSNATESDSLDWILEGTDPAWRAGATGYLALNALAAAILAAAQIAPIHADMRKINNATLTGAGVVGNEWGPA